MHLMSGMLMGEGSRADRNRKAEGIELIVTSRGLRLTEEASCFDVMRWNGIGVYRHVDICLGTADENLLKL